MSEKKLPKPSIVIGTEPGLVTQIVERKLSELKLLAANARFMPAVQFGRLVENIVKDGRLTSAPLIYKDEVLSGNHRVMAAIKAGVTDAHCIEITSKLSKERRVAIQLAHNAIAGDDDPNTLESLYKSLGIEARAYSGLSDDIFSKATDVDLESLALSAPPYFDMVIEFLPEQHAIFEPLLARIEKYAKAPRPPVLHVAHYDDFNKLFDALIRVKDHANVYNSAIALRVMAELAIERIEEVEAQNADPIEGT